jgi:hypothetical protein
MRAFRPSRFGSLEDEVADPSEEIARIAMIQVYAKRAKANEPLFQEDPESHARLASTED